MLDKLSATDILTVGAIRNPEPVANPCPKCGKGGKEHTQKRLICSSERCRHIYTTEEIGQ